MDSDWAWLPPHLLDSIVERIERLMDYLQFSAVCTSWNSVAKISQSQNIKTLSHQAPLLLIPSEEGNLHSTYDAITNNFLKSKLVVSCDKGFAGSSHGWLVVVQKEFSVILYKPYFTVEGEKCTTNNTIIHLPPVFPPENPENFAHVFQDYVFKATITADPVTNPDECTVMVIFGPLCKLAFIRPTKDTTWTSVDSLQLPVDDVLYCNDRFYAQNFEGELYSFGITDSFILEVKLVASKHPYYVQGKTYLVESYEKKLLQVVRFMDWIDPSDNNSRYGERLTTAVIVYELDLDGRKWVEINSLGDLSLFLGDNSSISVLASKFPGCKPNNIYFTHDRDSLESGRNCINDIGAYDLESRRMELHFGGAISFAKGRLPIWIVPTLHEY